MGEHEQGGMLRIVVILGLIALIAGASLASLQVLKGQMSDKVQKTLQISDMPQTNAQIAQQIAISDSNVNFKGNVPGSNDTTKWRTWNYNVGSQNDGVISSTAWIGTFSPIVKVPDGAKTAKISVDVKTVPGDTVQLFVGDKNNDYQYVKGNWDTATWRTVTAVVGVSDQKTLSFYVTAADAYWVKNPVIEFSR